MLLLCIFYTILMPEMKVTYVFPLPTFDFFFFFFENINPMKYNHKIKHIVSSCLEDHENNTTCFL